MPSDFSAPVPASTDPALGTTSSEHASADISPSSPACASPSTLCTGQATLTRLTAGFQRFQQRWFCAEHNLYADLYEGQNPLAMVIACSDSRVDPVLLTDSPPGDLFVVRNVANIVPPYAPDKSHHGVSAALEYAVRYLHVEHIIIMGHAECGGIHNLLENKHQGKGFSAEDSEDEFLSVWMQVIHRARDIVNRLLPHAEPAARRRACEMWGIRVSLENLLTFPWVRSNVENGSLALHGWYFDLGSGELLQLDPESDEFLPLVTRCPNS